MIVKDHIAAEIRAEIARQRLTQTELAARMGISQAAFSRNLNGRVPLTVDFVQEVAGVLGVPISRFLNYPDSGLTGISHESAMLGVA